MSTACRYMIAGRLSPVAARGLPPRNARLVRRIEAQFMAVRWDYRTRHAVRFINRLLAVADAWGVEIFAPPHMAAVWVRMAANFRTDRTGSREGL